MSSLADMWSHGANGGRHAESTNVRSDRADDSRKSSVDGAAGIFRRVFPEPGLTGALTTGLGPRPASYQARLRPQCLRAKAPLKSFIPASRREHSWFPR